jgi:sigma-B regulation protein RsbQ
MAQHFARVTFLADHRTDVLRLTLPTLVVQCQEDFIAPAEIGGYLVAHLPQAQLVTLPAAGQCPQLSAPLATLAALRAFLSVPIDRLLRGQPAAAAVRCDGPCGA